jgi:hypothetical protein
VWNLQDDGSAHVFRRKKLRFAHDDAILVYDWYQSDGKSTKPVYKPEGSKEVHKFVSDGRRFTVVALDRPRNRGEECEFVSERTSERAFEKNPDRVIARALDPTGLLSITIRWPKNRPPKEVRIIRRTDADRGMPTSVRPHKARDGRMEETVKVLRPQLGERVGMEWDWEPSPKPVSQATPEEAPATIAAEAQASPNGPSSSVPQPAPPADS